MTRMERASAVLSCIWDTWWRLTGELFWSGVFKVMSRRG